MALKTKTKKSTESVPQAAQAVFNDVVARTDEFSRKHLTEEFTPLCRELAAKLARKRPSPMLLGRPEIWAAAVVYVIAKINFLFDRSVKPHITPQLLNEAFGTAPSSVAQKVRLIQDWFDLMAMDPRFTVPSKLADNPLVWMLQVDGVIVDIRNAPRAFQEEAYRRGLIPFVPGRPDGSAGEDEPMLTTPPRRPKA